MEMKYDEFGYVTGLEDLKSYVRVCGKPINYRFIPCSQFKLNEEGIAAFNQIYTTLLNSNFEKIVRTPSGGISVKGDRKYTPSWDLKRSGGCIEITLVAANGAWRLQARDGKMIADDGKTTMSGRKAFLKFSQLCRKYGIDLEKYAVSADEGKRIKSEIEKPYIKLADPNYAEMVMENCYHLDFHSSYPSGLVNAHPEFKPVIDFLYNNRKGENGDEYKAILNYAIGFMQSIGGCHAAYAQLAKDAIADNNRRIREMTKRLEDAGYVIISYNTDGIWYRDVLNELGPYHGEGEGDGLGQWSNDHLNCRFRAKSAGSYEFIENGKYTPVVRGSTKLDAFKPRSEWQWGDIFQEEAQVIQYYWDNEQGIVAKENDIWRY